MIFLIKEIAYIPTKVSLGSLKLVYYQQLANHQQ